MFVKRIFDVIGSLMGILIFFPLILFFMICIKMSSRGPIFFLQKRLTKDEKIFTIYKFRSLNVDFDAQAIGIQIHASHDSISYIGKIMRKTKIDELPQLFNILKGDMSFIGPRPELPRRLSYYSKEDKEVFQIRSGLSSPASILFSDEEVLMEKVKDPEKFYIEEILPYKTELNLYYIKNRTFFGDIYFMLLTIFKLFFKISEEKIVKDKKLLEKKQEIVQKIGKEY
ncbi:sugar transferase [Fusobacterium necrophorum]|uniref:Glycosyl transferase n=1 Tax=Fusobacterium necrophorum DJ-2 TaxID=1441737 RepID=A0AB73C537_9FUSO|nr:sugar transferase [Fusobacterium necrophorum]KDE62040.1 glycosyl transferase [Fusobacterium necrophorum BFTR-1]KDE63298.1 glycosyl transferase [Fusobacterium necrophorum DJ-1]KDE67590.1 glycosyl transferase [Fusobacterium necrophorum DAB]KDE73217.1 glycosyl transferase [Fusobacterium necrophorum DJ-2]MBR8823443.1 Undecaprenyl phosphate N,N'-diacetylbacillosamine 1-phosphate transferase [Fusobacterium necrophorum]